MKMDFQNILAGFQRRKLLYLLYFWLIIVFVIIFAFYGFSSGRIIAGLKVAEIKIGSLPVAKASNALSMRIGPRLDRRITLVYNNRSLSVVPSAIGIGIDIPATIEKAYRAGRTGPVWARFFTRLRAYQKGMNIQPVFNDNRNTLDSFYRLLDAIIAVEPIRSEITVNRQGVISYTPSRIGKAVDQGRLTNMLEKAISNPKFKAIEIPVVDVLPSLTEADIHRWGLDQVLSIYETKLDLSKTDRVQNVKTACSAMDSSLIYPGQSFSFNTWVGPRVSEAGYKEAPVIYLGKLVPGVGGGVCQVSSTLYNTVLLANLKITQRFNHTLPSAYVPIGRDATVVDGGIDFIFENTNPYPILITAKIEGSYVTIAILGAKTGWDKVVLETKTIETYPFQTKEIPDPTLPEGTKTKYQEGLLGYKVELWREVFQSDGQSKKELVNTSIYPAQPEEYKIGTQR